MADNNSACLHDSVQRILQKLDAMNRDSNSPAVATRRFSLQPLRALLIVLASEILVSIVFIIGFCYAFTFSKWLILIHLPLAPGLYAASLIAPGLLLLNSRIRQCRWMRYLFALIPGSCFTALMTLYVIDFVGYKWLGAHVNYEQVLVTLKHLWIGRHLLPLSARPYVVVAGVTITLIGTFIVLAPKVFHGVEALLLRENQLSLFNNRSRTRKSIAAIGILLFAYAGYLYIVRREAAYSELLSSDPIISFARNTVGVFERNHPAFIEKLKQDEQRCRENYRPPATFDAKNVIIIVVDSLRADHLSLYGYRRRTTPFLESLAKAGRLRQVDFATSACTETACGVLATLNSKSLKYQIVEDFKLHELLAGRGYDTFFVLSGDHSFRNLRAKYGNGMTFLFDGNNSKQYDLNDDRLIFEGLEQVPPRTQKPAFFLFHLMSPHILAIKQEEFRVYNPSHVATDWALFFETGANREAIINNYDNGILQADAEIKRLFEVLEQKQYLQNSLVIILSDHGESLGERGVYGHSFQLYQENIRIPLLIYDPSPTNYASLKFGTQLDIAPTILDRLKLPVPECWEGRSLLRADVRATSFHQTQLRSACFALINRTDRAMLKYIYCSPGKTEELYDLIQDPNEQNNLIDTADASLVQSLRSQLQNAQAR